MSTKSSRLRRIIFLSIFSTLVFFLLAINAKQWYRRYQQQREIGSLRTDIARLQKEEQSMRELLEDLQSPLYIEREGRKRLGYKKEGETAVIFPSVDPKAGRGTKGEGSRVQKNAPYVIDWFAYFFPRQ